MAITTLDELVAGMAAGQVVPFSRRCAASIGGGWFSIWTISNEAVPCAGATPPTGAGAAPTNATAGALPFINPGGGDTAYLAGLHATGGPDKTGHVMLYDRLVHTSGLSGTSASAQTVNSAAITRPDANGEDVELWLEWYTNTGSTLRTFTVSYTNQAGTSGKTASVVVREAPGVNRLMNVPLAAGDTGIRSVQTVTLSGSTGTIGDFGITLLRRIAVIGAPTVGATQSAGQGGIGESRDAFTLGLPEIPADACLSIANFASSNASYALFGTAQIAVG